MPSDQHKRSALALEDIRTNILLARKFCEGHTHESLRTDVRTLYAVVRCLEIISEASRRLLPELKARHPALPWIDIAGAGNIYRHGYDAVLSERIWNTVAMLDPLLRVVEQETSEPEGQKPPT